MNESGSGSQRPSLTLSPTSTGRRLRRCLLISCAALAALATAGPAQGQGVRGTVEVLGRYIQMRPVLQDTVDRSLITEDENGNLFYGEYPVYCSGGEKCEYWRSLGTVGATTYSADLSFTAWGLGTPGLSATATLRVRDNGNSEFVWPQTTDSFDAMLAYLQYVRGNARVRVGRMRTFSGLGFSGFDGVSAYWEPRPWVRVEGYGGRSLARGLYDPRHEILEGMEAFHTNQNAGLIGGWVAFEPWAGTAVNFRYQREIWRDRSALLSERGSVDFRSNTLRSVSFVGAADWDFAFGKVGKAHLTAQVPWRSANVLVEATARRYRPYFELWTIWGFFSPVAYREAEVRVNWAAHSSVDLFALGAYRRYQDHNASITPWGTLESDGTRFGGGINWRPADDFTVDGRYTFSCCAGARISSGEAQVRWNPNWRVTAGFYGTAFQQIQEYRLGEGLGVGAGLTLDLGITRRAFFTGGISTYQHMYSDTQPANEDWDQIRGWAGLRIDFGSDPGMDVVRRRRR